MSIEGLITALRGFVPLGTVFALLFAVTSFAPKPDELPHAWWSILWYVGLVGTAITALKLLVHWLGKAFAAWSSRSTGRRAERARELQVLEEVEALPAESRRLLLEIVYGGERFVALDDWDPHVETLMHAGFLVRRGRIGTTGARFEVPFGDWRVLRAQARQMENGELGGNAEMQRRDAIDR